MVELKRVWFIEPVMIEKNICEGYTGGTISLNTSLINYPVIVIEINETAYRIPLSNVKSFIVKESIKSHARAK